MKAASSALATHIAGEVTTLASCWRVTRKDGAAFFFTDHDRDLVVDGQLYQASTGYSRTAITNDASLSVDNLDVDGVFDAATITEEALRAGLFDHAEVRVFLVNWADLSMGVLKMRRGWFGEVMLNENGKFRTDLRGMAQALQQRLGEIYSPECRADLGDGRCKVGLAAWTRIGTVTAVTDRAVFIASVAGAATADGWFNGGLLTWATGANAGRAIEVKSWTASTGRIELFMAMGYVIASGDTFAVYPGCDKRIDTCIGRFGNVINFRGEPYVPGIDAMMQYPDAAG
jgi:uncharacterized phage protein (TIGR02218 family)